MTRQNRFLCDYCKKVIEEELQQRFRLVVAGVGGTAFERDYHRSCVKSVQKAIERAEESGIEYEEDKDVETENN